MSPSDPPLVPLGTAYAVWLVALKQRIRGARQQAALAANHEQIALYHDIGREILERQVRDGWGAGVIPRLSADLREEFPEMRGFSTRNLKYMRTFAEQCPDGQIGQQSAAQLPWFHIVTILTCVPGQDEREWYAAAAVEQGWSRDVLGSQIKSQLHLRQGAAVTNFGRSLPVPQAGLAQEVLKDPYHFDFTGLGEEAHERDIENALVRPEQAGKLNFYLAAVDAQIKASDDKPTIGLLLCRSRNRLVAEYALSGMAKQMGVAEYAMVRSLPSPLDTQLPTIEQLEAELSRDFGGGE